MERVACRIEFGIRRELHGSAAQILRLYPDLHAPTVSSETSIKRNEESHKNMTKLFQMGIAFQAAWSSFFFTTVLLYLSTVSSKFCRFMIDCKPRPTGFRSY